MNDVNLQPRVSIILNSFKNQEKLRTSLEALSKTSYLNKELIIVTHGITNKSVLTDIETKADKLIDLEKDVGAASQRNIGYINRDPESKYVLFVDDDVKVNKTTLSRLIEIVEKHPDVSIAQPMLVNNNGLIDCCGMMIDQLGYSYYIMNGEKATDRHFKDQILPISYAVTACALVNVHLVQDYFQRPFDDSFYFNYEDVDFCLRNWIKDHKVVCIPSATATHNRGRTANLGKTPENLVYLNTLNKFRTLFSVYDRVDLLKYIPLFIMMEIIKSVRLINTNFNHSKATFQAISTIFKEFKTNLKRRRKVQTLKKASLRKNNIIKNFNIRELGSYYSQHYSE